MVLRSSAVVHGGCVNGIAAGFERGGHQGRAREDGRGHELRGDELHGEGREMYLRLGSGAKEDALLASVQFAAVLVKRSATD